MDFYQNESGTDDLKDRLGVYLPAETKNEMGETVKGFSLSRTIWGKLSPSSGRRESKEVAERAAVTHKVTVRKASLPDIRTDMYFMHNGSKLYVQYWYPIYNRRGWIEVFCTEVIE